jgi:hypothetical protein
MMTLTMMAMMRDDDDPLHLFFSGRQRGRPGGGIWMHWWQWGRVMEVAVGGGVFSFIKVYDIILLFY